MWLPALVLKASEAGSLVVSDYGAKWNGDYNPLHLNGFNTNQPTDEHFAKIGLPSMRHLDAAVQRHMLDISTEDLDLPSK
ncbi:hypothetical protein D3C83_139480 [compost metagenome]